MICFEKNHLQHLPEKISNLKRLELLFLSDNSLTSLPDSFMPLHNLRGVTLHNNAFNCFPSALFQRDENHCRCLVEFECTTPKQLDELVQQKNSTSYEAIVIHDGSSDALHSRMHPDGLHIQPVDKQGDPQQLKAPDTGDLQFPDVDIGED